MKKTAAVVGLITSTLIFTQVAFAQDSTASPAVKRVPVVQKIDARTQNITNKIASREADINEKRMMLAEQQANFKKRIEDMRLKIASGEARFKERLQQFKDKQKAEIAQRVNTNLNRINQNQTDQMLKHLDQMSQLLDKLVSRVDSNSPDIKNPAVANQAIADAREAIANAKAAVEAQAQKDYTINVTTETKIRQDAQAKRNQLHKDLLAVRKQVIDAKQAVSNAIRVAKSGVGSSSKGKIATPSAQVEEETSSGQ